MSHSPSGSRSRAAIIALSIAHALPRRAWVKLAFGFVFAWAAGAAVAIAVQRAGGWTTGTAWDIATLRAAHRPLPSWLDLLLVSVPWLGTNITIFAVLIPLGTWLVRRGHKAVVAEVAAVCVGNYLLNLFLKLAYGRPRPSLFPRRGEYTWASYPSGHAIAMLSVLLFVAVLLRREKGWLWPYVLWLPTFVAMIYSRVYLGVHWPTDVVGGLAVGLVWFVAVALTFRQPAVSQEPAAQGVELPSAAD